MKGVVCTFLATRKVVFHSKIMDWADKFAGDQLVPQRKAIRDAITNPENPYYGYIRHILKDVDPHVMKTTAVNFFINTSLVGWPKQEECLWSGKKT